MVVVKKSTDNHAQWIGSCWFHPMASSPHQVRPHIDSTSDQVLKIYLSLTEKKDNIVCTMKQNHTKHVYFSFFNPLKVTDDLKVESSG